MGNIQVVVDFNNTPEELLKRITTGAAIAVKGTVVESLGKGQRVDIKAESIEILGDSDPERFPLQPKKHSLEFLREIAHLRFRTNTFNAVFKLRHALAFAIHQFYNERGFVYMHTPVITASDAEGAGEMALVHLAAEVFHLTAAHRVDEVAVVVAAAVAGFLYFCSGTKFRKQNTSLWYKNLGLTWVGDRG